MFNVRRSSYYYRHRQAKRVCPERARLQQAAIKINADRRGAAGARIIAGTLTQQGESVGRYKAKSLMKEMGLVSKQEKKHRYKTAQEESVIAENKLNRDFTAANPNQAWCGDATYV